MRRHDLPGTPGDDGCADDRDEPNVRDSGDLADMIRAQADLRQFEPLYLRYHRPVFGYCLQRLRDREAAADATAQTFARALAAVPRFRSGSVAAWLFTIARHVVIDDVRARRPQVALDAVGELIAGGRSPEELAVDGDEIRQLAVALDTLTPDQRHVVSLRLAGLTAREVAEVLGTTTGAVKASQHRALIRLRAELADPDDDDTTRNGGPA